MRNDDHDTRGRLHLSSLASLRIQSVPVESSYIQPFLGVPWSLHCWVNDVFRIADSDLRITSISYMSMGCDSRYANSAWIANVDYFTATVGYRINPRYMKMFTGE